MKTSPVTYISKSNQFSGKMATKSENISQVQALFLNWLQEQPVYKHLWQIEFSFEEIEGVLE